MSLFDPPIRACNIHRFNRLRIHNITKPSAGFNPMKEIAIAERSKTLRNQFQLS